MLILIWWTVPQLSGLALNRLSPLLSAASVYPGQNADVPKLILVSDPAKADHGDNGHPVVFDDALPAGALAGLHCIEQSADQVVWIAAPGAVGFDVNLTVL